MNNLEKYFRANNDRQIHKWIHYFDIYDRHFSGFRNKKVTILEIGVFQGGSLQMWKNYFGDQATIYGIDINPECKNLEEENISIFIGSQSDRNFLKSVKQQIPKIDILIDDGGHTMSQQIITFEELFDHVSDDGIYLCEDLMTSYWLKYGGGLKRRGTFIEYSKNFIDFLHGYHSVQKNFGVSSFTKSVDSIHYYDGIIVIEKKIRTEPVHEKTGKLSYEIPEPAKTSFIYKVYYYSLKKMNVVLRFFRLPGIILK